jgi:hypothetical protein
MNPLERFLASIAAIQASVDQLPDETVRAILAQLEQARRQVLVEIAAMPGDTFNAFRARELEARIRDVMARFVQRYQTTVAQPQALLYEAGQQLAGQPLVEAGVTYGVPQIPRRPLEVAQSFQALLISNATDETINAISTQLRLGLLRGQSVPEIAQGVAGQLTSAGPFGSLAARAEAITRTELGRIQAIAAQSGLEESQRLVPDLRKQWQHSGNTGRWRRIGHVDADGQVRDVNDAFRVRPAPGLPYEDLMYPRDPAASPKNTINCGCLSLPFREAWRDAIANARTENADFLRRRAANTSFQEAA